MNNSQQIRRSQFILTYGPGSIIEGKDGPRVMLDIQDGLGNRFSETVLEKYEINNERARRLVAEATGNPAKEIRLFSLPTNESENKSQDYILYKTRPFPLWKICYNRGTHSSGQNILYKGEKCPECNERSKSHVRFVCACPEGHMDDVDWCYAVHKGTGCNCNHFHWSSSGATLSDIRIVCPICGTHTSVGETYGVQFLCRGNRPEEWRSNKQCQSKMKVMQRQSTSLRQSEVMMLLELPSSAVERFFKDRKKTSMLSGMMHLNIEDIVKTLENFKTEESVLDWIKNAGKEGTSKRLELDEDQDGDYFVEEYNFIREQIEKPNDDNKELFEFGETQQFETELLPRVYVTPIEKLKTITLQVGYTRNVDPRKVPHPRVNPIGKKMGNGDMWFPCFESTGEGLWITFSEKKPKSKNDSAWESHGKTITERFKDSRWWSGYTNPLWIKYHTMSHALIKAISLHCGYPTASIRERIYHSEDGEKGAILLYTSSVGEDGSLGGLSGSIDFFEEILEKTGEAIYLCSNDPFCSDRVKTTDGMNGAACHSCLMISETSCEHGNRFVDRHIIYDLLK